MIPKHGIDADAAAGLLRDAIRTTGWVLCIGAGTSRPLFPTWPELVTRLAVRELGDTDGKRVAGDLLRQFGADALIQAAANRFGPGFVDLLSSELYATMRAGMDDATWKVVARQLSRPGKKGVPNSTWLTFLAAFRRVAPDLPALGLAELLADILGTDCQPAAILSFNAEAVLYSLVNAVTWERATRGGTVSPAAGENRQFLDLVTRSISGRRVGRVPYVFCHGVLPVPEQHAIAPMVAVDKLVFSEGEYLQLANNAFSWQASAFLDACTARRVLFLGVSLSDPNMRRWLSWTHTNRLRELNALSGYSGPSTFHYWLCKRPTDGAECSWLESSVEHLGVRVVWLTDWADAVKTMRSMLRLH